MRVKRGIWISWADYWNFTNTLVAIILKLETLAI